MLYATNTANAAGMALHGDLMDFEELYEALHEIVGEETDYLRYEAARIRILSFCYDLRHAMMQDRVVEFVENGMDEESRKRQSTLAPAMNVYYSFPTLWPEACFVMMALEDFVILHERNGKRKAPPWERTIAAVRKLQAAIASCLQQLVSEASYRRMVNQMHHDYTWFDEYATQYVDLLNQRFLAWDKEKRLKNLPAVIKRLEEKGEEYRQIERQVRAAAIEHKCSMNEIELVADYPEEIEW